MLLNEHQTVSRNITFVFCVEVQSPRVVFCSLSSSLRLLNCKPDMFDGHPSPLLIEGLEEFHNQENSC